MYPSVDDQLARKVLAAIGAAPDDDVETLVRAGMVGEQLWFVREGDDGSAELRVAEGPSPFEQHRRVVARCRYEDLRAHIDEPVVVR